MKKALAFSLVTLLICSACGFRFNKDGYKNYLLNNPKKVFNSQKVDLNEDYINSLKEFSSSFYRQVSEGDNEVFSPISIATCFSMLLDGAKEESQTELEALLHYSDSFNHLDEIKNMLLNNAINRVDPHKEGNDVILDIAQSLWVDDSFKDFIKQDYVDKLTDYYYAEAMQGELASEMMHNALADYINKKTYDFFNLTGEDFKDFDGVLWLLNTIYLKSPWATQFDKNDNIEDTFLNLSGDESNVTYMTKITDNYYYQNDDYLISSFDLESSLRMNVLLPNENTDYQAVLNSDENLSSLLNYRLDNPQVKKGNMHYRLPKFKLMGSYDLKEVLQEMNVKKIFNPVEANLRGICELSEDVNLYVEKAKHEAGIAVDNKGIEAAAYTIIGMNVTSIEPKVYEDVYFYVNRPFAYTITSGDGLPLFMGVTTNL